MTVKAIETRYKGWRFRSRLEARWAVFFEAIGIGFEYEPEGFSLPSGPYLPDFKLTSFGASFIPPGLDRQDVWVEVKPRGDDEDARQKCAELSLALDAPVLLVVGTPDLKYQMLLFDASEYGPEKRTSTFIRMMSALTGPLAFTGLVCEEGHTLAVARSARSPVPDAEAEPLGPGFEEAWRETSEAFARPLGVRDATIWNADPSDFRLPEWLKAAFDKCRAARFEFGQAEARWLS